MKKLLCKYGIAVVAILLIWGLAYRINALRSENDTLRSNQSALLSERESVLAESQLYKVSDSLNAAKVSSLQLSLSEYKRYREKDMETIKALKLDQSGLRKVISAQVATIKSIRVKLNDTIVADTTNEKYDTLRYFSYTSKYTDVEGLIHTNIDSVSIRIHNRESLKIVESVTYKRFLGFLWKTNRIKSRQIDVLSENPNTSIVDVDYISIDRKQSKQW